MTFYIETEFKMTDDTLIVDVYTQWENPHLSEVVQYKIYKYFEGKFKRNSCLRLRSDIFLKP